MYETLGPIAAILGALLLGAMSPGPSLVYVAQKATKAGRTPALMTAVGMGLGGMLFATMSLLGLGVILSLAPNIFFALRILGAAYLAYVAYKIWLNATEPFDFETTSQSTSKGSGVLGGFAMQIANPKTIIVYSSVFVAALPNGTDFGLGAFLVLMIFALEFGWYAFVAFVFSSASARSAYAKAKATVDRTAAIAMGGLAAKVAWDAMSSFDVSDR